MSLPPPPNQADGFGRFDAQVDGTGQAQVSTLVFYLHCAGMTAENFAKASANGNGQDNVFFAARVAGFSAPDNITSGHVGDSSLSSVPLPAGVWLLLSGPGGATLLSRRRAGQG